MNEGPYSGPVEPLPAPQQGIPIPLAKPIITNVLLVVIGIFFLVELFLGGWSSVRMLYVLGAQSGDLVAAGQYWRLLTAMFIHLSVPHLLFNGWALYIFGRDVEAFYGSPRFAVIYLLAGLFGNVLSYVLGRPDVWSAGASGAIFGLVGADVAFFLVNRKALGRLSQRQLINLGILVAINVVIGFAPGIDYLAHLGGLAAGFVLGLGLAPRYSTVQEGWELRLISKTSAVQGVLVVGVICLLLLWGVMLGNEKWSGSAGNPPGQGVLAPIAHQLAALERSQAVFSYRG